MKSHNRPASPLVRLACLALSFALLFSSVPPAPAASAAPARATAAGTRTAAARVSDLAPRRANEIIVSFRTEATEPERTELAASSGATRRPLRGASGIELWAFGADRNADAVRVTLSTHHAVEYVEPNYLITADQVQPNDPRFSEQWALSNAGQAGGQPGADIGTLLAWAKTTGSRDTVIAVIDSGIDFTHPDLQANRWVNATDAPDGHDNDGNGLVDDTHGWDWMTDSGEIKDKQGHGTAVAGLIAARGNNRTGTTGVMWRAGLMSLRVLDAKGTGEVARAVEAIDYAAAHGASVINLSWGTDGESKALAAAIARANDKGTLVVASAGNDARNIGAQPRYPAAFELPNIVSVAATDRFDQLTSWSNWGAPGVTVTAPGEGLLTTKSGGDYHTVGGTSASAALVSGMAGLIKTLRPQLRPERVREMLVRGVRPTTSLTGKVTSGGVVSAGDSIVALGNLPAGEGEKDNPSDENGEAAGQSGNQSPIGPGGGHAGNGVKRRRRVSPAFDVGDLPGLNELRRHRADGPKAPTSVSSRRRRHRRERSQQQNDGRGSNAPHTDSGIASNGGTSGGSDLIVSKYAAPLAAVQIASNYLFDGRAGKFDAPSLSDLLPILGGRTYALLSALGAHGASPLAGMLAQDLPNDAAFVSQDLPAEMNAGQQYTVTVRVQNTGSSTWTTAAGFKLGSQYPQDTMLWRDGRVALPASVGPDQIESFTFTVTAPSEPGVYPFGWRMLREGVEWFGQYTPQTYILVKPNAAFVSQTVPAVMRVGQAYPVSVTVRNTSPVTWTNESSYRLGSRNPQDNTTWGASRAGLPGLVSPNTDVTVSFTITAPATPGVYNFQWQMVKDGLGWFGDSSPNVAVNVTADGTYTPPASGALAVSEFRTSGPGGAYDEFVELYNKTGVTLTVSTQDGSSGWALVALMPDGTTQTRFVIPAGTVLPPAGNFLAANGAYSLSASGAPDLAYTGDIPDGTAVALFRTSNPANFTAANRLDAVAFAGVTNSLFLEGTPLAAAGALSAEHSFVRNLSGGGSQDTNNNAGDFIFISATGGTFGGVNSVLGAPGPTGLTSPARRSTISTSYIDPSCTGTGAVASACFRARDLTPVTNGAQGTLSIRRRWTNNTGAPVTRLRFRVVDITTLNTPGYVLGGAQADLRLLNSSAVQVTKTDGTPVTIQGTTLEEPPAQGMGGGLNSTASVGTVTLATPLAPGNSVNTQFLLGVQQGGTYRFLLNVEGDLGTPTGQNLVPTDDDFATARLEPANRTGGSGVDLRSGNYNWSLPLVSLKGRAGLDLGLALAYNSRVWTKSGSHVTFDADNGSPSPGFRLGFPTIQPRFVNTQTGARTYLLITPNGDRVELRATSNAGIYESVDSSYLQLTESGAALILRPTDGSQLTFMPVNGEYQCVQIADRNGNYITVEYGASGQLGKVTDTLGREINFVYDSFDNLQEITQTRNGVTHRWATFGWGDLSVQTNFIQSNGLPTTMIGLQNGSTIPVLTQVGLDDGSLYRFDYTAWAQVNKITRHTPSSDTPPQNPSYPADYTARSYVYHHVRPDNGAEQDCPRVRWRSDWAQYWNAGAEVTTIYIDPADTTWVMPDGSTRAGTVSQAETPGGTIHKVFEPAVGRDKGLSVMQETWANGVKQRWSTVIYDQLDQTVSYPLNPRARDSRVCDSGNCRKTTIDYTSYGLPTYVKEYEGSTVKRYSYTAYNLNAPYIDPAAGRRIIGLVTEQSLYGIDPADQAEKLYSKVTYDYDLTGEFLVDQGAASRHLSAYGATFNARGNVGRVHRWDVKQPNTYVTSSIGYNTNGSVIFSREPITDAQSYPNGHEVKVSYADAFIDSAGQPRAVAATFAYPTEITDPDGNKVTTKFDYDLGVTRQTRTPRPNVASYTPGPMQTLNYDAVGRVVEATNSVNAARAKWSYPASLMTVQTRTKVLAELPDSEDAYAFQVFDGAGRVRAAASDLDAASGTFAGRKLVYDKMGRMVNTSNQTEITGAWVPTGADASEGWVYSAQEFDWKGRPTAAINQDSTQKTFSYQGCGCAGGEVVEVTDEVGRRQRISHDTFGRVVKVESQYSNGSNYVTSLTNRNTYNLLDQLTVSKAESGNGSDGDSCPALTCQLTTMSYDGHGRIKSRHLPSQDAGRDTTYTYNSDDTLKSVKDARNVTSNYGYNNGRHLVSQINYDLTAADANIQPASSVSFAYDAAGNRVSMNDQFGSQTYVYDDLSQLTAETREINEVNGSYTTDYTYALSGALKSVTYPSDAANQSRPVVNYVYNRAGLLTDVTGANYGGVASYASGMQYSASGAIKNVTYGNGRSLAVSYNSRQQVKVYDLPGVVKWSYEYDDDGLLSYSKNFSDPRLDRGYQYDSFGDLYRATTGSTARGESTSPGNGPYLQNYSHDAFGNLAYRSTQRENNVIATYSQYSTAYDNNRDQTQGWTYTAGGQVTQSVSNGVTRQYGYNAAGALVSTAEPNSNISQFYDGDGSRMKRIESNQPNTYYISSAALGGQVLTEVNAQGAKLRGYVYTSSGQLLAKQENSSVQWDHKDPSNASNYMTGTAGNVTQHVELDPLGVATDINFSGGGGGGSYIGFYGNAGNAGTGCYAQSMGVYVPCSLAETLNGGFAQRVMGSQNLWADSPLWPTGGGSQPPPSTNPYDAQNNYSAVQSWFIGYNMVPVMEELLVGTRKKEGGKTKWRLRTGLRWASSSQQTMFVQGNKGVEFTDEERSRLSSAFNKIRSYACKTFIERLLNKYHTDLDERAQRADTSVPRDLDELLGSANINKYDDSLTAAQMGISETERANIRTRDSITNGKVFNGVTNGTTIWLPNRAFWIKPVVARDLAGIIVHELLHVAFGPSELGINAQITKHCGNGDLL